MKVLTAKLALSIIGLSAHVEPDQQEAQPEPEPKKSRQVLRAEARQQAIVIEPDLYRESRAERYDLRSGRTHPINPKRKG